MSARCPTCDRLVSIRTVRIEASGRHIYRPEPHLAPEEFTGPVHLAICPGGEIR